MIGKNKKKIIVVLLILLLSYLLIRHGFSFLFCPFYELTGLYCPGCGVTRMILSIFEFDFYQAFRFNPLLFLFLPFFILCFLDELSMLLFSKKSFFVEKVSQKYWIVLLIIFIIFGVLRNIPYFDFLIPTLL